MIGRHVANSDTLEKPGDFCWGVHNDEDSTIVSIILLCPACGSMHSVPVKNAPRTDGWDWNGDLDAPTLSPSIFFASGHAKHSHNPERIVFDDCRWHGWLRNGEWINA